MSKLHLTVTAYQRAAHVPRRFRQTGRLTPSQKVRDSARPRPSTTHAARQQVGDAYRGITALRDIIWAVSGRLFSGLQPPVPKMLW